MKRKVFEKLDSKDRTGDISLDVPGKSGDPWTNDLPEKVYNQNSEHPTPEQMMIREAIKSLTPKQKRVWELYNYDKMTQDEIAQKLNKKRTTIETQITQCEKRIAKWIKSNLGAYNLLKEEYGSKESF